MASGTWSVGRGGGGAGARRASAVSGAGRGACTGTRSTRAHRKAGANAPAWAAFAQGRDTPSSWPGRGPAISDHGITGSAGEAPSADIGGARLLFHFGCGSRLGRQL